MLIPTIAIWLVLGYIGGRLFARKGYPPKLGIINGVLFGPMALLICAFFPKSKEGLEQAELERELDMETAKNSGSKRCPKCNRDLGIMARVCPRCEHRFDLV